MDYSKLKIKDEAFTKEEFGLKRDKNGILQTYQRPQNLSRYYDFGGYISHQSERKNLITKIYNLVKQYMFKTKLNLLKQNHNQLKSVLDYGCGTGEFVNYLEKQHIKAEGFEPTSVAFQKAKKNGICVHNDIKTIAHTFDAITLFHVLEHVEDYEETISELLKRLKPKGIIAIAVPNYKSYDANYYKEKWAAWDVPRHLWHFSKTDIENIAKRNKLKVIKIESMPFDAFYISMVSESYKGQSKLRGLWIGLISNLKAKKSKEYSSNLFLLQKK